MKVKRAALYLRVSTDDQTTENQRLELRGVVERAGWRIFEVYEDAGVSGAKGREQRPAFNHMLRAVAQRKFDVVMAWSVDRLGRSLPDLAMLLRDLHAAGCDLYLHQQGIDTTTPAGRAMFQMMGVFAELERALIQERVKAGMARAKAQGRHVGRPKTSGDKEEAFLAALREGGDLRAAARKAGIGIGVATASRIRDAARGQAESKP
jgi:DNA invertase Pin-like site-specific DNA recombinase